MSVSLLTNMYPEKKEWLLTPQYPVDFQPSHREFLNQMRKLGDWIDTYGILTCDLLDLGRNGPVHEGDYVLVYNCPSCHLPAKGKSDFWVVALIHHKNLSSYIEEHKSVLKDLGMYDSLVEHKLL